MTLPPLRRATAADARALTDLTQAAFRPWVAVIGREPTPMQTDYTRAIAQDRIDILEHFGPDQTGPDQTGPDQTGSGAVKPVGLIHMVPHPDHLWVETIAVHPDHQGLGLGHHLMAHAEQMARSLNLAELRLLTNAAFTANLPFYTALGFTQTARPAFRGGFVACFAKRLTT